MHSGVNKIIHIVGGLIFMNLYVASSFAQTSVKSVNDSVLYKILIDKDSLVNHVLRNSDQFELQLIYTKIIRHEGGVFFEERNINQDKYYYYPASIIKFPLAIVALEYLYELQQHGVILQSKMKLKSCSCDRASDNYIQKSMRPTPEQILREMLIMSNNDAYNVFFDMIGIDRCNARMKEMGFNGILLKRRFTSNCTDMMNRKYGGIELLNDADALLYTIDCDSSFLNYSTDSSLPIRAGKYHFENGKKIKGSRDYSNSNIVRLTDAHHLLIRLFYPETIPHKEAEFKFDSIYKSVLFSALGNYPRELLFANQSYQTTPDYYYKFFIEPGTMNTKSDAFKVYNKVGLASGFISDVSYFEDKENNISFFVSAAILAKKDGIIGGGVNNYYDIGIPVFRKIGALLYKYELDQK